MLHALLHGKLDEARPEPARIEDALTSTVFGALLWAGATEIVVRWLGLKSFTVNHESHALPMECWFWPRLEYAEPDVLLRVGDAVVVVEAKYRSGRHDQIADDEFDRALGDQLVRQYRSMTISPEQRRRYPDGIERSLRECRRVQVFLVDAQRQRRARREWLESQRRLPAGALLLFATWQDLVPLLREQGTDTRWAMDLRDYLGRLDLDVFEGVGRGRLALPFATTLRQWRHQSSSNRLRGAVEPIVRNEIEPLLRWRGGRRCE